MTAEQEELVAKMLASGMDEATAYQYLQQLCGVAGKGSKLTLKIPYLQNPSQKCCTAISLLISTIPHTTQVSSFLQNLPKGKKCQLCFEFFLSCALASRTSIILQLCATNVAPASPPLPCLKANCLQKPSAMWEAPSVSELLRNRLRMQRKY